MAAVGRDVLVDVLILMVGARVIWFGDFFFRCWKASKGQDRQIQCARAKALQSSNDLHRGTAERHRTLLEQEARRLDIMLVGGSIGLAAWGQLFVSTDAGPASRLSGFTLGLLFAGAFCLITGPLLWRSEGLYLTLMGRTSALHIGFGLVALSLASAVLDLNQRLPGIAVIAVAFLIGLREVADVFARVRHIHPLLWF